MGARAARASKLLRSVRRLRLLKLRLFWGLLEEQINSGLFRIASGVLKMLYAFCVFVHGISCIWYFIGKSTHRGWQSYDRASQESGFGNSLVFWYFASCRWTL